MAERGSLTIKLTVDDLCAVQEELYGARTHWYNLGLKLGLKVDTLDTIKTTCSGDPRECFREMLKGYLTRVTPLPSWRSLVEALRSPTVDQPQLAKKVEQKYCPAHIETKGASLPLLQEPLLNAQDISVQLFSPVSKVMSEALIENELHSFAMQMSTSSPYEEQQPKDFGCGCGKCNFHSFLEKGCPKPIPSMSSFQYLNTEGLSHSERKILKGRLYHEFEMITTDFSSLVNKTCESLIREGVTVKKLVRILMILDAFQPTLPKRALLEERIEELKAADSIDDVFFILRGYMSFFSYHIIEYIIHELGTPQDEERLQNYITKLDKYTRHSIFECPIYSLIRRDQAKIVVKLEGIDLEEYNAKYLEVFQARICSIIKVSKYTLRLCTVEKGCLQLTFQIPTFVKEIIFPLFESQKIALQDEGVIRLTCDDYQCLFKETAELSAPGELLQLGLDITSDTQMVTDSAIAHECSQTPSAGLASQQVLLQSSILQPQLVEFEKTCYPDVFMREDLALPDIPVSAVTVSHPIAATSTPSTSIGALSYNFGALSYNFGGQSESSSNLTPFGQISNPMNAQLLRELQTTVPADMKTIGTMKVERKKARSRIAASKCRVRRLQRESDLQKKVKMLQEHNQDLDNELNELKEQIVSLKKALLQHMQTGCQVNLPEGLGSKLDSISSE